MKKQTIWILTILMAITFVGLLCVQVIYLKNLISIRNEQFTQGVRQSLVAVAMHLEHDETRHFLEKDITAETVRPMAYSEEKSKIPESLKYSFTTPTGLKGDLTIQGDLGNILHQNSQGLGARNRHIGEYHEDPL